jgi:thiol-disulfide isomerase/thioredoxin
MIWLQTAVLCLAAVGGNSDAVLLDFCVDGCVPCQQMAPTVDQLASQGYPVRKINASRDPATAQRYGVKAFPTFLLVSGGRVVDGVVGATSYDRLADMFRKAAALETQAAQPGPPANMPARMPSMGGVGGSLPAVASGPRTADGMGPLSPIRVTRGVEAPAQPSGWTPVSQATASRDESIRTNPGLVREASVEQPSGAGSEILSTVSSDGRTPATGAQMIAATVRLRIEDPNGHSCGTGTIIDARSGWALVLTCGHLFRDSQGKGRIDVEMFGPDGPRRVAGELVSYDSEKRDLGLVRMRVPGRVCVAPVAPADYQVAIDAPAATVGCSHGADPTVERTRIRAKNKFVGPPNFQTDGLPVEGRSGGGLFSAEGYVIGVCNAADPTDNAGLFAALDSIHTQLDQTNLAYVYQRPSRQSGGGWTPMTNQPEDDLVAVRPPGMAQAMPAPPAPADASIRGPVPTSSRQESPQGLATQAMGLATQASQGFTSSPAGSLSPEETAALEAIRRRKAEGAEVICIIRSPNDPTGKSEILRLDRASNAFLQQLAAEASGAARP